MRFALLLLAATLCAQAPDPVASVKITPDERRQIEEKIEELDAAIRPIRGKAGDDLLVDVEVYLKAAKWIVRYDEFYSKAYVAQTLAVLQSGMQRAQQLANGHTVWPKRTGSLVRAYRSRVDGSIQPYALTVPEGMNAAKPQWLEVNLHGRGATLNEVSFIYSHEHAKPAPATEHEQIKLDVFGRANVAYRWAGETEVFEAIESVRKRYNIDPKHIALRGFSMGGGGAWHLGLHHPDVWSVVEAGAGFVESKEHGKVKDPTIYASIYDVLNVALNAVNTPTVGYGGEIDPQRRASVFVREELGREGYHFTPDGMNFTGSDVNAIFLTGPQTAHKWHPDSKKVSDAFVLKSQTRGLEEPANVRFVTYTERYNTCFYVTVDQLEHDYQRAQVDANRDGANLNVATKNVARLTLKGAAPVKNFVVDGQSFPMAASASFEKADGKWRKAGGVHGLQKVHGLQGPIDDAFMDSFLCVKPGGGATTSAVNDFALQKLDELSKDFPKWLRGDVPVKTVRQLTPTEEFGHNIVAFGTPATNSLIAEAMKKAPIEWTEKEIVVGAKKFDASTHLLSMIYPNPDNPKRYLVVNSGHTFREADFKGTNVLLYPRAGDWAVTDIATGKIVAEGVFDRNWKLQ